MSGQVVALPHVERLSYDLGSVCRKRFSPDMDFILGKVSQLELANLLHEATDSFLYRNDLEAAHQKHEPRVSLNVCLYNVEGIPNGAYQYDSTAHALHQVQLGDHRLLLQSGMSLYNVNLLQVPLCLHVTGERITIKLHSVTEDIASNKWRQECSCNDYSYWQQPVEWGGTRSSDMIPTCVMKFTRWTHKEKPA